MRIHGFGAVNGATKETQGEGDQSQSIPSELRDRLSSVGQGEGVGLIMLTCARTSWLHGLSDTATFKSRSIPGLTLPCTC